MSIVFKLSWTIVLHDWLPKLLWQSVTAAMWCYIKMSAEFLCYSCLTWLCSSVTSAVVGIHWCVKVYKKKIHLCNIAIFKKPPKSVSIIQWILPQSITECIFRIQFSYIVCSTLLSRLCSILGTTLCSILCSKLCSTIWSTQCTIQCAIQCTTLCSEQQSTDNHESRVLTE